MVSHFGFGEVTSFNDFPAPSNAATQEYFN